jgi:hypothetical protein
VADAVIRIENGQATFVYSDELAQALAPLGQATVTRASHVEPHPTRRGWLADMRPSGGPVLGCGWHRVPEMCDEAGIASLPPFETREAALQAEREWLRVHKGL